MSKSVGGSECLHALDGAPLWNVLREVLAKLAKAHGFRPLAQQPVQEIEIGYRLRHLKTQLRIGEVRLRVRGGLRQIRQCLIVSQNFVAQLGGRGSEILVVEESDFSLQVVLFLVERGHFEAPLAQSYDIHAAVRIHLGHAFDGDGAAGVDNASVLGQHDAEFGFVADRLAHHFLIALFENVERQTRSGEDHDLQREEREHRRGHATIICKFSMRLEGKVAIITGASEGIGAACAAEFARAGCRLSLTARSEDGLRRAGGADALITPGDLLEEETRRGIVERTLERFGSIDILINNAGAGLYAPSWRAPMDDVRRMMELNFYAPMALTQLVMPGMRARRSGMIVNIGSIGGKVTLPWMTLYSASKFALGSWTEGLRMELFADNVRTLLVCPGYVKTGFQEHAYTGQAPARVLKGRRFAITPEQCALAIRRGVERDARTVVTPRPGWLLVAAARLFPAIVERRLAAMNETA